MGWSLLQPLAGADAVFTQVPHHPHGLRKIPRRAQHPADRAAPALFLCQFQHDAHLDASGRVIQRVGMLQPLQLRIRADILTEFLYDHGLSSLISHIDIINTPNYNENQDDNLSKFEF